MGVRTADGVGLRAEMACLGRTDLPGVGGTAASAADAGFAAGRRVTVEMTGAVPVAVVVRRGRSPVEKGRAGIGRIGSLRVPDSPPGSWVGSRQRRYKRTRECQGMKINTRWYFVDLKKKPVKDDGEEITHLGYHGRANNV